MSLDWFIDCGTKNIKFGKTINSTRLKPLMLTDYQEGERARERERERDSNKASKQN